MVVDVAPQGAGRQATAGTDCMGSQEKPNAYGVYVNVPQTDTGRWGENPKAREITFV